MIKKISLLSVMALALSSSFSFAEGTSYIGAGLGVGNKSGVNLFGGYGEKVGQDRNYYLGGELLLNSLSYSQLNHTNYGLSASLIPGIFLNNKTMAYTRLGVEVFRDGSHHSGTGAQLGLGLQTNVAKNWDVRGEYAYTSNINTKQFNVGLVYKFE